MAIVVEYIKGSAPWVYGACALVALICLRKVFLARRERKYAVFTLERERALNQVYSVWAATGGIILVMVFVYLLSTYVSPAVQPLVDALDLPPSPTSSPIGTPTASPTLPLPEIGSPTATPTARPKATRRPEPTVVVETPAPRFVAPSCPDARAVITSPAINQTVSGMVPIMGTAVHERFQFYKLEYGSGADPSVWSYFDGGDHAVQNGRLGTLNADLLPSGVYSIRIVSVDATGNFPTPCQTTIIIP